MPAPLFHRKGGDGGQELKLYKDVSGKSAFILKVGSGKAEKAVRLPKSDPLQKAMSALGNAIPEDLVDILLRWKPEQMDEDVFVSRSEAGPSPSFELPSTQDMDVEYQSPDGLDDTRRNLFGESEDESPAGEPMQSLSGCLICGDECCRGGIQVSEGHFCEECRTAPQNADYIESWCQQQLDDRAAAAKQPPPQPPPPEPEPPRRSKRASQPPTELYDLNSSGKGQPGWSDYYLSRAGERHDRTREQSYSDVQTERDALRDQVDVARRENAELSSSLDGIFARLREIVVPNDCNAADVEVNMAAAIVLREAITELVDDHERRQVDEQGEAADGDVTTEPPPPWQSIQVRMGGTDGAVGHLALRDDSFSWVPVDCSSEGLHVQMSSVLYADYDEDDEDSELRVELSIRMVDGDFHNLYFPRTGAGLVQRHQFQDWVNRAASAAQQQADAEQLATQQQPTESTQPVEEQSVAPAAKRPRVETRAKQGAKLRAVLREVSQLKERGKHKQAAEKVQAAACGSAASKRTIRRRASEMSDLLFSSGGLETSRAVLDSMLERSDVKQLLPAKTAQTRQEMKDAKTARSMLEAAKHFFSVLMDSKRRQDAKNGGRRSDVDRNAFWASAASLLPRDIFKSHGGRAAMRILGVSYSVVKQAAAYRGEMEDRHGGWRLLKTRPHSDRVEGSLIAEWWHTNEASTEDNANKQPIRVFHGFNELGEREYEIHWRRAREGSMKECLTRFQASEQAAKLREQTKTLKRPEGIVVGTKLLKKFRCPCVRIRGASECDDHLTTAVAVNLPKWNRARQSWYREAATKGVAATCPCRMHTLVRQGKPELLDSYMSISKGIGQMEDALLTCGKVAWPAYHLEGERPFKSFYGACCLGKCPKKGFVRSSPFDASCPVACGWDSVFGSDCPIECSDEPYEWLEWKQQLRGNDLDGQPTYAPELVPVRGTRRQFLEYIRGAIAAAMPHRYRAKMLRRGLKVHEALKPSTTATFWSDYGAQMESDRLYTQTCARRERHNICPMVIGFNPYVQVVKTAARGKRPASEVSIRKQHVVVVYGMFKAGYKPDARSYNVQREDAEHFLKTGRTKHGEWWLHVKRVPREGGHREPLPDGMAEWDAITPMAPQLTHSLDILDGCAAQFAGKNNYHQDAVWATKTGVTRNHFTHEANDGKGPSDGYNNVPKHAVKGGLLAGELLNPGTRDLVIFCAKRCASPREAKATKHGWWAANDYVWAFYDTALFTKAAVPEAEGYAGSMENHQHVGLCRDPETAERDGPLQVRGMWCGCKKCVEYNFTSCLMRSEFGPFRTVYCKLAKNQNLSQTRSVALEEFAHSLAKGQVRAVNASRTEWYIEGPYWLALILGTAYQATEDMVIAGQEIPKGYWLVEAQWYKLVQTSQRAYVLLKEKIILNVNSMVRLPEPIVLEVAKARKSAPPRPPPPPSARSSARLQAQPVPAMPATQQREKPNLLSEQRHNDILASLALARL